MLPIMDRTLRCKRCRGRNTVCFVTYICVCTDCLSVHELTIYEKENSMATRTINICDRPRCGKEFPVKGGNRFLVISVPMDREDSEEIVTQLKTIAGENIVIDWDVDNGCDESFKIHIANRLAFNKTAPWVKKTTGTSTEVVTSRKVVEENEDEGSF